MFTGLIEEIGSVRTVLSGKEWGSIAICCQAVLEGTKIGDSIAINGVCLTVTALQKDGFTADVMAETLGRSNLGHLQRGSLVNLERAMPANGRFGGHIVSGHVDGIGHLIKKESYGNAILLTVSASPLLLSELAEKGSVTLDGVSLTVVSVTETAFTVSVIPHTGANTTLTGKKISAPLNIETDILAKYIHRIFSAPSRKKEEGLSLSFLEKCGFS